MNTLSYKTKSASKESTEVKWYVVDAAGKTLGRVASQVAAIIRGKNKPYFTPHVDCGDFVIVVNASQIQVKGKRQEQKEYMHHTGYPGGERFRSFKDLVVSKPEEVIELAVKGMLPKNRLGSKLFTNLHVFVGAEHDKQAQQPKVINLDNIR